MSVREPVRHTNKVTGHTNAGIGGLTPGHHRWWALVAVNVGAFMAILDITIVNVALPTIGEDLHTSFADLQWVVNAYTLTLAVLMVTAGRLADIFGRKRFFLLGLGMFALGSLLCGLSGTFTLGVLSPIQALIAARAFQGIGGSILLTVALAIIAATFSGRERGTAIGIYGGGLGLALAVGPLIGGMLVSAVGWQAIFFVNVPLGVVGIALVAWAVSESFDHTAARRVDLFGLVTLSVSVFCLVLALIQGNDPDKGWTSPYILALFAVAAVALVVFVLGELRLTHPMVDPRLFGNGSFTGASFVAFAFSAGLPPMYFFLTLYLQNYLRFSPLEAGLRFLPLSGLVLVVAPLAGALSHRLGPKLLMTAGMATGIASVLLMTTITPSDTRPDWVRLLPAFLLSGVASGMVSPAVSNAAVSTVARTRAGMAAGVSGVCRQVGTAFGIAFLGAILTAQYDAGLQSGLTRLGAPTAPPLMRGILKSLERAGALAGSTGLRGSMPGQEATFGHQAVFPQVAVVVQRAYIDATIATFHWAAVLMGIGLLAALVLVKRADMNGGEVASASKSTGTAGAGPDNGVTTPSPRSTPDAGGQEAYGQTNPRPDAGVIEHHPSPRSSCAAEAELVGHDGDL